MIQQIPNIDVKQNRERSDPTAILHSPTFEQTKAVDMMRGRSQIFEEGQSLGWQILDAESKIYSSAQLTMDIITKLTGLYSKVIEKLNGLQDNRQSYFTYKMQKLMSEPYIIRCFNNQKDSKKMALESRRKELELKIEKQAERQNHRAIVEKTIDLQKQKQKRMINQMKETVEQADRQLDQRIRRRKEVRLERSMELSPSSLLDLSLDVPSQDKQDSNTKTSEFQLLMTEERTKNQKEQREKQRLSRQMSLWQKRG